jgi:hypothetical protein
MNLRRHVGKTLAFEVIMYSTVCKTQRLGYVYMKDESYMSSDLGEEYLNSAIYHSK